MGVGARHTHLGEECVHLMAGHDEDPPPPHPETRRRSSLAVVVGGLRVRGEEGQS